MKIRSVLLSGAVLAALTGVASGQSPQPQKPPKGPPPECAQDMASLCPGLVPGDGKLGKCMQEHRDQLSPACKQARQERQRMMKQQQGPGAPGTSPPNAPPAAPQ